MDASESTSIVQVVSDERLRTLELACNRLRPNTSYICIEGPISDRETREIFGSILDSDLRAELQADYHRTMLTFINNAIERERQRLRLEIDKFAESIQKTPKEFEKP